MKIIFKYLILILFLLVSIYSTDYTMNQLKEKDPIMQQIKQSSKKYKIKPTDAKIIENSIIPGTYGKDIDYNESYSRMKKYGMYNESLTKLKDVVPTISIEKNKNKYLIKGNDNERNISIIVKLTNKPDINYLLNLLTKTKADITFFIDGTLLEKELNTIRKLNDYEIEILSYDNEIDEVFFKTSISYLNQITKNKVRYCLTDIENDELLNMCSKEKMYTIKEKTINNDLYKTVKNSLEKGKIFVINENLINELEPTLKYINKKGYNIVRIDCLLSEKVC